MYFCEPLLWNKEFELYASFYKFIPIQIST